MSDYSWQSSLSWTLPSIIWFSSKCRPNSEINPEGIKVNSDQSSIKSMNELTATSLCSSLHSQMAIEKYNTDLSALTKTCEEMKKLYSVILVILELLFQYLFCTASEMDRPPFQ